MYSTQDVPSSNAGKLAVFRNIDIMDTIFDALLVKYDADACERKHLFQAALTAKNFYDPAMNILWRSLDSLLPVLKLIPGFQELIDPPIEDSEYYVCKNDLDFGHFSRTTSQTTTKAISEEDLVRVDWYCRRVRHLTLLCNPSTLRPRISAHIYSSLSELRRFGLFPALRWLNIDLDELLPDDLHLYGLLLLPTPTLSHVLCSGIGHFSEVHVATFLTRLSRIKTQSLQHLSLRGKLSSDILDTLPRSSKVTSLDLDIDEMMIPIENMIAAISHLTALRRLGLTFWNHDSADSRTHFGSTAVPVTIVTFEQLKELQIDAYDARQLCTFLVTAVKHMPVLKRLTINFELDDEDEAAGDDLMSASLFQECFLDATRYAASLEICTIGMVDGRGLLYWKALKHIRNWKSLKHLQIIIPTLVLEVHQSPNIPSFFIGLTTAVYANIVHHSL